MKIDKNLMNLLRDFSNTERWALLLGIENLAKMSKNIKDFRHDFGVVKNQIEEEIRENIKNANQTN